MLWLVKGLGPGGAERLLLDQAARSGPAGPRYEVAYVLPQKDHLVPALEARGVRTHCLGRSPRLSLGWVWRLRRLLAGGRYDVLHAHSPYPASLARLACRTIPRGRRPALLYTEHNVWPRHAPVTRIANRLTYPLDDGHLAVSEGVKASIPTRLRPGVEVVLHGIDVASVAAQRGQREAVRAELGIPEGVPVVGTVANLRVSKGYPDLLRAARILADQGVRAVFVAVGQGPLEDDLASRHAALGLDGTFRFLGYREDAVRVAAAFDVFTLASWHEGLPLALLESLALGVPAVVTDVGGVPEVVSDGVEALLVPPGRPERLAAALAELLADPERRAVMGRTAATRAAAFDIGRALNTLEDRYRALAARRSTGPPPPRPR